MAKVLIGYSCCHLTRSAFAAKGHDVWTADLLPSRDGSANHLIGDIHQFLDFGWDFAILHPMCTYLTVSGAWAFNDPDFERYPEVGFHQKVKDGTLTGAARRAARDSELSNFRKLLDLPFPTAIENPAISFINKSIRPPDQKINPYDFGDDASKNTGIWLTKGTPKLKPTKRVPGRMVYARGRFKERWGNQTDSGQNNLPISEDRWLIRSQTYPGIAAAMGDQWGAWLNGQPPSPALQER